jgi:hypothetical protein
MPLSRHSCDELMSRSFNDGGRMRHAADGKEDSQASESAAGDGGCGEKDCRRCLLDKLSNRGLSLESGDADAGECTSR